MPIPGFQSLMRPLLVILAEGEERPVQVIRDTRAEQFGLTEEDLEQRLPSGRMQTFVNRVAWALAHLKGAACIEPARRGVYRITDRGQQLLADTPEAERVDVRALNAFKEYQRFRSGEGNEEAGTALGPKWREAIRLCREVLADRERFDEQEVANKHKIAAHIRGALEAAEGDAPLIPALKRALGKPNNLLDLRFAGARFSDWMRDEAAARGALRSIRGPGSTADRVDGFNAAIPPEVLKTPGNKIGFASFFLMGSDPAQYPMYRPEAIKGAEQILGWPDASADSSLGQQYEHHVAFVADFRDRLVEAGLELHDMLDAQSLIWTLMKYGEPQFKAWRGERPTPPPPPANGEKPTTLKDLASELYVKPAFLHTVVELLEEKRQLIFYGPPGTGKTYMARRLAQFLAGGASQRTETVQFHPSYSYEDFIQGYRPRPGQHGNLSYELADGPLLRLANRAREAPDRPHVLLIDEINRGNLPRIFGELLYLLEYRDDQMALMYSSDDSLFALPPNLWVLGTMNTADRSIGLVDAALRRRFHFKALFPGRAPLDGLLAKWLADKAPAMAVAATYVDLLNTMLRERFGDHLQVGHSYFMVEDLDEARLELIWEVDILPFLEDQLFGKEGELERFQLASIKRQAEDAELTATVEALTHADDQPDRIPAEG
ncbi:MAG: winged helix-turn-helix domain-containing protein [Solirubrobacteraceae bacterium]